MSFDRLVHALRMMDVVVLLRATNLAIKEIAGVTGYRNLSVMDVIFQRLFHLTPSAFRFAIHPRSEHTAEPAEAAREFVRRHPNAFPAHIADATGIDLGIVLRAVDNGPGSSKAGSGRWRRGEAHGAPAHPRSTEAVRGQSSAERSGPRAIVTRQRHLLPERAANENRK